MKKLVFDADGVIKLTKSGVMNIIVENYQCAITKQVYEEAVTEGKKRLYQDALEIERLFQAEKIKVISIRLKLDKTLGKGEASVYQDAEDSVIVSDDRKFLAVLYQENRIFVVPAHVIAILAQKGMITQKTAVEALNKIKKLITKDSYTQALYMLEEK